MSGIETRQQLIDAALRAFAERGVQSASLLEITRLAEQRNRGAVHYHFGTREALLAAALEQQSEELRLREAELLAAAVARPDDLSSAVEALIRPAAELARGSWRGRCYLIVLVDLLTYPSSELDPAVLEALVRPESRDIGELIGRRLPPMDEEVREARLALIAPFVLRAVAEWARATSTGTSAAAVPVPDMERFVTGLVALCTRMLTAPVPPA